MDRTGGRMPQLNSVIDLSHHNQNLDFQAIKDQGQILAIIHKATHGLLYVDPTYQSHSTDAAGAGLLWGAYHFGTGSDGIEQAEHFLDCVNPCPQTLLGFDLYANHHRTSMNL